jgi:hypothetical protein
MVKNIIAKKHYTDEQMKKIINLIYIQPKGWMDAQDIIIEQIIKKYRKKLGKIKRLPLIIKRKQVLIEKKEKLFKNQNYAKFH